MANEINLPKDKELANKVLDNTNSREKQKIDQGWLGYVWGASASVPNNIAGLSAIVLMSVGIFYTFFALYVESNGKVLSLPVKDFWSIITPIITLSIGYLFGHKPSTD